VTEWTNLKVLVKLLEMPQIVRMTTKFIQLYLTDKKNQDNTKLNIASDENEQQAVPKTQAELFQKRNTAHL
jgi:hypothetical protein